MSAANPAAVAAGDEELVSVVVPTFNGAAFIAETLRCVQAQTHRAVELIIVDDGSTDDTLARVRDIAPQALLLQQANAGVASARNRGLAAARGRFLIFLDQDDVWHPLQLERQLAWMRLHPQCGAVVCPYHHWVAEAGAYPQPQSIWPADPGLAVIPEFTGWVYHQFLWDCWAQTSGTLFRREVVQACGGYDTALAYSEDWDLHLRISLREPFAALRWPPVLYRHHEVQGSRTVRAKDFRAELLLRYAARHGLASRDGRAMDARRFAGIIAASHYSFGYLHLRDGQRWVGVRALLAAWRRCPVRWKYLLLALAGAAGWRPRREER